jgi:hypothetical protein
VECTVDGLNGSKDRKKYIFDYLKSNGDINLCVDSSNFASIKLMMGKKSQNLKFHI